MTTATRINARTEALTTNLQELKDRGQIADFQTDHSGTKLIWTVILKDEIAEVVGDFHTVGMSTPEAEAFAAGVKLGAKRKPGAGKPIKDNPFRNAIVEDGRVEVEVASTDAAEQKRLRTALFNAAYSVGLKGKFKVHTEDGKLVGEVTDKRVLRGLRSKHSKAAA